MFSFIPHFHFLNQFWSCILKTHLLHLHFQIYLQKVVYYGLKKNLSIVNSLCLLFIWAFFNQPCEKCIYFIRRFLNWSVLFLFLILTFLSSLLFSAIWEGCYFSFFFFLVHLHRPTGSWDTVWDRGGTFLFFVEAAPVLQELTI